MNGNGWDLRHAPITALRIADAKRNIFAFGMLFLNPTGYRHALEAAHGEAQHARTERLIRNLRAAIATDRKVLENLKAKKQKRKNDREEIKELEEQTSKREQLKETCQQQMELWQDKCEVWTGEDVGWKTHLLLRIWSCVGYSRGRYWSAFSLWRGLGFIGEVLELALKEKKAMECALDELAADPLGPANLLKGELSLIRQLLRGTERAPYLNRLVSELQRLIRSHCLATLVPGSLLSQDSTEELLLHGSPRWEPSSPGIREAVRDLAERLAGWLALNWRHVIYPLPAGKLWLGWGDCFIRRIHGEAILGGLWPRINAAYLEEQGRPESWRRLALQRSEPDLEKALKLRRAELKDQDIFRWSAAVAAGSWSDALLEYWRGCPPILELLLTCPVFFKSRERFTEAATGMDIEYGDKVKILQAPLTAATRGSEGQASVSREAPEQTEVEDQAPLEDAEFCRYKWLARLAFPIDRWQELEGLIAPLVPDTLCIERANPEQFSAPAPRHLQVGFKPAEVRAYELDSPSAEGKNTMDVEAPGTEVLRVKLNTKDLQR
jgi:hypothetical protein